MTDDTRASTHRRSGGIPLDTVVATPSGWVEAADLRAGSAVFNERGRISYLSRDPIIVRDRPTMRVSFSDGSGVVADAHQLWISHTYKARHHGHDPKVVTTEEMAASLRYGTASSRRPFNHAIQRPQPLQYPRQAHLVDPYVLGVWLGDGSKHNGTVTTASWDAEDLASLVEARGYPTKTVHNGVAGGNGRLVKMYGDFQRNARALGLLLNKHVPESYLRGDVQQRLDLLCGLMDSDGSSANGRCEFYNTNRSLIDGVAELVRSLGCHGRVSEKASYPDRLLPQGHKPRSLQRSWRVSFSPTFTPFKLPRKIAAFHRPRRQRGAAPGPVLGPRQWRTVTSVAVEATRDIVRVEIETDPHLLMVGRELVTMLDSTPRARSLVRASERTAARLAA
ncbi:LAGLIDADG family homing endonuclease [Micromonospora chalcea]|uniref:LAGLIDADG family homing endonuclease n=1 Tax=Micromonospora chalcea TaxID=1874 RepID=UPI00382B1E5B